MCDRFEADGNMTWRKSRLWLLVHTAGLSPEACGAAAVLGLQRIPLRFTSTGTMGLRGGFLILFYFFFPNTSCCRSLNCSSKYPGDDGTQSCTTQAQKVCALSRFPWRRFRIKFIRGFLKYLFGSQTPLCGAGGSQATLSFLPRLSQVLWLMVFSSSCTTLKTCKLWGSKSKLPCLMAS